MRLSHAIARLLVVGVIAAVLGAAAARAQTNAPSVAPEQIQQAARVALAQGVDWFKQRAEKDPEGWLSPPGRIRRLTGWTNVVVRYKMVKYPTPVFAYTNVVTFVPGSAGQPPQKVVQQMATKQIGTVTNEYPVADPNGPLERENRYPIYEPGGSVYWRFPNIGDAALATYALRRAGVPNNDPVMQRMLQNLADYLHTYGPPDQTWNLAWLTAVLAGTPGKDAADWTQKLAARILDGQITDGAARGLWGPECFHSRLLAVMLRQYLALIAELEKHEAKLKQKPNSPMMQGAVEDAKLELQRYKELADATTHQLLRFVNAEVYWSWDPTMDPVVSFGGATHFFYNQTAADLESTYIALFGLSVAAEHNRLPAQSLRPAPPKTMPGRTTTGVTYPPPEQASAVLARAANALAALQDKNGLWNECNFHQPVTDFNSFTNTLPVPADPKSFPPLPSPFTPASVAEGIAALESVGRAASMERLLSGFRGPYFGGVAAERRELKSFADAAWPKPGPPAAMDFANYELYLALARPLRTAEPPGAEDELTRLLVLAGQPGGSWGTGAKAAFRPSSTRQRYEVLAKIPARVWSGGQPVEMNKAHLWTYNASASGIEDEPTVRDAEGYATAIAVLYLASRVDDPAGALRDLGAHPTLPDLRKTAVLELLGQAPRKPTPPVLATPTTAPSTTPPPAPATAAPAGPPKTEAEKDVPDLPAAPADDKPKADEKF